MIFKFIQARIILFLLVFAVNAHLVQAQSVEHVQFAVFGSSVIVSYDLIGGSPDMLYTVDLFLSADAAARYQAVSPLEVSGDIGFGIHPGKGKSIKWQPCKSVNYPAASFKVNATFTPKASDNGNQKHLDDFMEMVYVEGGTFKMGCNDLADSKPIHSVSLGGYYIGKYEVTQKQWQEVMGTRPSFHAACDNCPVENVSWDDVEQYIKKLNEKSGNHYRLPTEAEWEFAARGGLQSQKFDYCGSNTLDEVAWYSSNSGGTTHPIGQKQANELGIFDMSGNVLEWCFDGFSEYQPGKRVNPVGNSQSEEYVVRGGSAKSNAKKNRSTYRQFGPRDKAYHDLGFRLAL